MRINASFSWRLKLRGLSLVLFLFCSKYSRVIYSNKALVCPAVLIAVVVIEAAIFSAISDAEFTQVARKLKPELRIIGISHKYIGSLSNVRYKVE